MTDAKSSGVLIDGFRRLGENPHAYARSLKEQGQLLAGYMCTHVPEEILYAAGVVPLRIISSHKPQSMTRSYLHETYCSFSHDCAYQGLVHNYDYLDMVVTGSSCLHMSEAFNVWARFGGFQDRSFLMPYPHIMHTKPARGLLTLSFNELVQYVQGVTKRTVTDEKLEEAILLCNDTRRGLRRLWGFLKTESPPITGQEVAAVTLASQLMDKREYNQALQKLVDSLEETSADASPGVRLMAIGGACDHLGVLDLIERLPDHAVLVFVDSCTAARYFWFEVPENRRLKLDALAEGYLSRIPCPAKDNVLGSGERNRFNHIQQFIQDFRPDGVIFLYQRFCSPQPMDVVALKPIMKMMGIPFTDLELDTTVPAAQFETQLEALVEVIKR